MADGAAGPEFWAEAVRLEMAMRQAVSEKTRMIIAWNGEPPAMTPAECWLYRKRAEWAGQLFLEKAHERVVIPESVSLAEVLEWALVLTWESDGCIALWEHGCERGGRPPEETPEYLRGTVFGS